MKKFSQLGITTETCLKAQKISMAQILNCEIIVQDYLVKDSKFEDKKNKGEKCLHLQILKGETQHVIFTSGVVLISQLDQIPKEEFPFAATIVRNNKYYEFT